MTTYAVILWLVWSSATGPLRTELPPRVYLAASSVEQCQALAGPIAAERAKAHAADVARTGGRVVGECVAIGATS